MDNNLTDAEGSYTYTVPIDVASDTIYHQLMAYGNPCESAVPPMTEDLSIRIQKLEAPTPLVSLISGPSAALPFSIVSSDWDKYNFIVREPGKIYVRADWSGSANSLALILNGPGQLNAYARRDGGSPLELLYYVTDADIKKGEIWSIEIYNHGEGTADGDLTLASPGIPFSLSLAPGNKFQYYFNIISPGLISTQALWTGTSSNLDLSLNGPGNFGTHSIGTSPLGKSYEVTYDDFIKGQTWSVSLENHGPNQWSTASGTIQLAFPGECCWYGTWNTDFGQLVIEKMGDSIEGMYEHDDGLIKGKVSGNKLIGTWKEMPTYNPPEDAGDFELKMSDDCRSFTGFWGHGYNKERKGWDGEWTGKRASGTKASGLRPGGWGLLG